MNEQEKGRTERFRSPMQADLFNAWFAALRSILSCYLAIAPANIKLSYGLRGWPTLTDSPLRPSATPGIDIELNV
jgi:phosphopantetheinyl transferase